MTVVDPDIVTDADSVGVTVVDNDDDGDSDVVVD